MVHDREAWQVVSNYMEKWQQLAEYVEKCQGEGNYKKTQQQRD